MRQAGIHYATEVARILNVRDSTVSDWKRGKSAPPVHLREAYLDQIRFVAIEKGLAQVPVAARSGPRPRPTEYRFATARERLMIIRQAARTAERYRLLLGAELEDILDAISAPGEGALSDDVDALAELGDQASAPPSSPRAAAQRRPAR